MEYNKSRKSVFFFFFLVLVGAGSDPFFFSKVGASLGATHIAAWSTNENEFGKRIKVECVYTYYRSESLRERERLLLVGERENRYA